MNYIKATDYTILVHKEDGTVEEIDQWFSLDVAKKIAAKAYDVRVGVVNSPVTAIEIINFEREQIQIAKF